MRTFFSGSSYCLENGIAILYDGDSDNLELKPYDGDKKKYFCGKVFWNAPTVTEEPYILVTMDANEITIGIINSGHIESLFNDESMVPNAQRSGGQSAQRFERARDLALVHWFKYCSDKLSEISKERVDYEIVLGGPGPNKENFRDYVASDVNKKIVLQQDIGYTNHHGLKELFEKSRDDLIKSHTAKVDKMVEEFSSALAKDDPLAAYTIVEDWSNVRRMIADKITPELQHQSEIHGFEIFESSNSTVVAFKVCYFKRWGWAQ